MRSRMVERAGCTYSFVFVMKGGRQVEQDTIIPTLSSIALPYSSLVQCKIDVPRGLGGGGSEEGVRAMSPYLIADSVALFHRMSVSL